MKEEIKKRFYDILFETDDDDKVVAEAPVEDVKPVKETPKPKSTVNAKDILYSGSQPAKKTSSFINLGETALSPTMLKPNYEPVIEPRKEYEMKRNISPIFGYLDEEPEDELVAPADKLSAKPTITKPTSGYLGTIISPIYGYAPKEDLNNTTTLSVRKIQSAAAEGHIEEIRPFYGRESGPVAKPERNRDAFSLEDILSSRDEKTTEREIDLFEDLFNGDKH